MITKKTYIPGKPRNKKLTNVTSGAASVGKTEFNQVAGESHTHPNKGVLDQITEEMLNAALRDILTSIDDSIEPSDDNLMSSLRVLAEILKNNETLKDQFLSKINPDTAQGLITFLKGINVAGNADVSGKTTSYELLVELLAQTYNLEVTNTATILNGILKGVFSSEEFNSGFLGSGFRLNKVNDRWTLELDDLVVRKTMQVFELVVQKIRYQGGQVLHSPAGGKITAITDGGSYWRCEHDSTDSFTTGAQVLCQIFKVGSEQQNPDGSTTLQGVSVKRYWRLVTSFGKGWFNLSKSDCEPGSSEPEVGDDVAVLGHRSDPDQQSAIMLVSAGTNSPYIAHYAGINSYTTEGKEVLREGNLAGIVDPDFGPLSGHGLYSSNAFLKGVLRVSSGKTVEEAIEERAGGAVNDLRAELVLDYTSKLDVLKDQIDIKVGRMRTGAKNLLRNYDMRTPNMKYWSAGATLVTESGTPSQQLTIVSVVQPGSITVAQGGAVYPPSTITLNISDGSTRTVGVSWGAYSSSIVGSYTISGTYNLPYGVTGNKPAVSFTLIVGSAALTAVSVVQPAGVSVAQGETPELPTTVTLNISDGTVRTVAVTWSAYNTTTPGTYTLTGTYNLPSGITGNKPTVSLSLTVAAEITILSVVAPNNATITAGGSYTPPATVILNLSTGTSQTVPVTWSFYDINVPGIYALNGTYNLPEGVTGSKPSVSFTLTVSEQPVSLTITSVVQPAAVSVGQGDTITLPSTVTLNISDGSTRSVAVTWGDYSTSTPGNFTIPGTYNLPAGVTGSKPAVNITITVVAPLTIISCNNWPFNREVYQGDNVDLGVDYPTLTFTLSDNTTVTIPVTWSAVDTSTTGQKTTTASYTNPAGVTGNYSVSVTITVLEVVYIDIKQRLMSTYGYTPADRSISAGLTLTGFYLENPQADPVFHNLIDSFALATPGEFTIYAYIARFYSGNPVIRLTYTDGSVVTSAINSWAVSFGSILLLPSGKTLSSATIERDGDTLFVGAIEIRRTGNYPSWWQ